MNTKEHLIKTQLHQREMVDIARECIDLAAQENCDDHEYDMLHEAGLYINFLRGHIASTGIKDRNGRPIMFGDIVRFADKNEWYRGKMNLMSETERKEYLDGQPYEERKVKSIEDYEWLLSGEIQMYWEVVKDET